MDFSLAALKLLCGQLKHAKGTSSPSAMTLGGIIFQRAWLQGVLISGCEEGRFVLDDGSGIIELFLSKDFLTQDWKTGMYVMVVGLYVARTGDLPLIKAETPQNNVMGTSTCTSDADARTSHIHYGWRMLLWKETKGKKKERRRKKGGRIDQPCPIAGLFLSLSHHPRLCGPHC
ncbi:uncharacterized protein LOC122057899 isoform X1 [Macadamia integrifolia]|uniref:uncharacterized protein LOC122057899 isoform X1 n=1 Tax=Macadamia integrifolia TaxID=60698 RepID=UPI001C52837D|nr:uncharacterized protein LOC122057899 isoform X1 [Macadamia integrifolia]